MSFNLTTPTCRLMALPALLAMSWPAAASDISGADTAWLLTATALVLFMTIPGLSLFYGGLVRVRNVLSVLMQCFALTALMSLVWFVAGYTIAFGSAGVEQGPWIGDFGNLFLAKIAMDGVNGSIPDTLFVMFQMTFAIITPALIVGAFAERMRFSAMLILALPGCSSSMRQCAIGFGVVDGWVPWAFRILPAGQSCILRRLLLRLLQP